MVCNLFFSWSSGNDNTAVCALPRGGHVCGRCALGLLWVHNGLRALAWGKSLCRGSLLMSEFKMMLKRDPGVSRWLFCVVPDELNSNKPPYGYKSLNSASGHLEIKISSLFASSILCGHMLGLNSIPSADTWSRRDSNFLPLLYLHKGMFVPQAELELLIRISIFFWAEVSSCLGLISWNARWFGPDPWSHAW